MSGEGAEGGRRRPPRISQEYRPKMPEVRIFTSKLLHTTAYISLLRIYACFSLAPSSTSSVVINYGGTFDLHCVFPARKSEETSSYNVIWKQEPERILITYLNAKAYDSVSDERAKLLVSSRVEELNAYYSHVSARLQIYENGSMKDVIMTLHNVTSAGVFACSYTNNGPRIRSYIITIFVPPSEPTAIEAKYSSDVELHCIYPSHRDARNEFSMVVWTQAENTRLFTYLWGTELDSIPPHQPKFRWEGGAENPLKYYYSTSVQLEYYAGNSTYDFIMTLHRIKSGDVFTCRYEPDGFRIAQYIVNVTLAAPIPAPMAGGAIVRYGAEVEIHCVFPSRKNNGVANNSVVWSLGHAWNVVEYTEELYWDHVPPSVKQRTPHQWIYFFNVSAKVVQTDSILSDDLIMTLHSVRKSATYSCTYYPGGAVLASFALEVIDGPISGSDYPSKAALPDNLDGYFLAVILVSSNLVMEK